MDNLGQVCVLGSANWVIGMKTMALLLDSGATQNQGNLGKGGNRIWTFLGFIRKIIKFECDCQSTLKLDRMPKERDGSGIFCLLFHEISELVLVMFPEEMSVSFNYKQTMLLLLNLT